MTQETNNGRRTITSRAGHRAPAFSLAELIVAMGILMLMLALAGQVMSLTVRATGQAKAVTLVNQELRILESTLREDLSHVRPGESLLLIQGNPINAYASTAGRDADNNALPDDGFPQRNVKPRADLLMFFTTRQATNYVQYDYADAAPNVERSVSSGVQQVTYGHADLVDLNATGAVPSTYVKFPTDPKTVFAKPADDWHLARRVVHLLDLQDPAPMATPAWADAGAGPDEVLGQDPILQSATDVMTRFDYERWVLVPFAGNPIGDYPFYWPEVFNQIDLPPYGRSVLDETPPPRFANRLGAYFVPHCVSFKVEWTLDRKSALVDGLLDEEKELYWIDPGADDPLGDIEYVIANTPDANQSNRLNALLGDKRGDHGLYSLRDRFGGPPSFNPNWHAHGFGDGTRPNLHVFTATRLTAGGELVNDDVFPAALRITIELVDDNKRLERPTRHIMIIPVGG